jgi:hypothetical protein
MDSTGETMSTIGTATSYGNDLSSLLAGSTQTSSPADASAPATPASTSDPSSSSDRDPATRVDLSDKIKAILARASTDQDVADRLKAFVQAHRIDNTDGSTQDSSLSSDQSSKTDVNKGFEQLSGGTPADDGSDGPVQVAKNFATGLKADGYTISAVARASDGSFQVQIVGPDGKGFLDRRFGTSGEFSTFGGIKDGVAAQSYQHGNKEYITFSESEAAALNVTASSDAGTISATSTGTHTASTTFVVDFTTGAISVQQSDYTSVSTAVQINRAGSTYSAVA